MRTIERKRAIALRRKGKTYSEIQKIISIPKSSLSGWLRDIRLTRQ